MNSRSARPPDAALQVMPRSRRLELAAHGQHLRGKLHGIARHSTAATRTASVTCRPNPPVAKITRARVRLIRSQVWVDSPVIRGEGVQASGPRGRKRRAAAAGRRPRREGRSPAARPSASSSRWATSVHELFVRDRRGTAGGQALGLVQEDQVEVAVVIQLAAAELAQARGSPTDRAGRSAGHRGVPNRAARRCHWSRAT